MTIIIAVLLAVLFLWLVISFVNKAGVDARKDTNEIIEGLKLNPDSFYLKFQAFLNLIISLSVIVFYLALLYGLYSVVKFFW